MRCVPVLIVLLSSCGSPGTVDPEELATARRSPIEIEPGHGDRLTDKEVVDSAYRRAHAGDGTRAEILVALTIDLENLVKSGGFGHYFTVLGIPQSLVVATAYREMDRDDLAATVERARALALTIDSSRLLGHPSLDEVSATFSNQLRRDDPTNARARFVRDAEIRPAR